MKINDGIAQDIDFSKKEDKEVYWHSTAHILATAVKRLYPDAKVTIGPPIDNGFYYDFDNLDIGENDLKKIENEMKKIMKDKLPFKREELSKAEMLKLFKDEPYKVEMIKDIPKGETLSVYYLGKEFIDFCRGPHVEHAGLIRSVKLTKMAGAYWKGDSNKKMLTRIYGISFPTREELQAYLQMLEEAKKRDHRVLGKKLDLYSFLDYAPGFPFFHDKGNILLDELIEFWKEEHRAENYEIIKTPQIMRRELWEKSGHWSKFKENMYTTSIEGDDYAIKPMNCPGGMLLYNRTKHSYKEFPLRVGELGVVHRHELSGTLAGLLRVRVFTQDDAHIFITEDQIAQEIKDIFKLVDKMYSKFGLEYRTVLSTRPEKYIGEIKTWDKAEASLKQALKELKFDYEVEAGDGAFYGPKIDILLKDALGREHQCGTIQLDMNLPERFEMTYVGADNSEHRPIMLHRVIYGSLERFLGIVVEHFAGKFPLWLGPNQIKIIPVAEPFNKYAKEVEAKLKEEGFRAEADVSENSMNKKIRESEKQYYNYILIVGEKEETGKFANVRIRDTREQKDIKLDEFIKNIKIERKSRLIKSQL